jgi:hypothetical protein
MSKVSTVQRIIELDCQIGQSFWVVLIVWVLLPLFMLRGSSALAVHWSFDKRSDFR